MKFMRSCSPMALTIHYLCWVILLPALLFAQQKPQQIHEIPFNWDALVTLGPIDLSRKSQCTFDVSRYLSTAQFAAIHLFSPSRPGWLPDNQLPTKAKVRITLTVNNEGLVDQEMTLEDWQKMPCGQNRNERCLGYPLAALYGQNTKGAKGSLTIKVLIPAVLPDDVRCDIVLMK